MRIWSLILLAGCRGFFNVPAVGADSGTADADLGPPIAFVQPASNGNINSMTISGFFALDEVAGDTNVAIVKWNGAAITSFSDTNLNTWTSAVGPLTDPGGDSMQIFVATAINAGHDQIDVSFSVPVASQIDLLEYANVAAVDQAIGRTGASTDDANTGMITTTAFREVLVGAFYTGAMVTTRQIDGFTTRISDSHTLVADEQPPGPAMYYAHVVGGLANDWVGELVALRGNH